MKKEIKETIQQAFIETIPVLIGFVVLGIAYGILMYKNGYSMGWSMLMSALAFCGSMQYVAITLLTTSMCSIWYILLLTLLVNARHLFYGISMLERLKNTGKWRTFLIFAMCDETFSILCNVKPKQGVQKNLLYGCIALLNYLYWVISTAIGGWIGRFISFNTKGLDFALTALFVVIFVEQWTNKNNHPAALIGMGSTLICLLLFGKSVFMIITMIVILLLLFVFRRKIQKEGI